MSKTRGMNRRSFIKQSTLGLIGSGCLGRGVDSPRQVETDSETPRIKEYRTLGRTGLRSPTWEWVTWEMRGFSGLFWTPG